jgi:hypothetical protein
VQAGAKRELAYSSSSDAVLDLVHFELCLVNPAKNNKTVFVLTFQEDFIIP